MSDLDHEALLKAQREQAVRDVIDSSRDDVPPPGGKERVFARLALEPTSSATLRPSLWRVRTGASVYLVGLALVIGGGMALLSGRTEEPPRTAALPVNPAATVYGEPEPSASDEAPGKVATLATAAPPPMAGSEGAVADPAPPSLHASPPGPSVFAPAPRPTELPRAHATGTGTPHATSSAVALGAEAARSKAPAHSTSHSTSTLGREVERMTAARAALAAGDAARTLAILDSYEGEFPRGAFSVEVSVLRVEALARAGRMAEARRLGERFLQEHPHGLFARRVASTLGTGDNPAPTPVP